SDVPAQQPRDVANEKSVRPDSGTTAGVKQSPAGQLADAGELAWKKRWTEFLQKLTEHTRGKSRYSQGLGRTLQASLGLGAEPNLTAAFVGAAYSKRLNYWGVERQ